MIEICFFNSTKAMLENSNIGNEVVVLNHIFNIGSEAEIEKLTVLDYLYINEKEKLREQVLEEYRVFNQAINGKHNFRIWFSYTSSEYCGMIYTVNKLTSLSDKSIWLVNCNQDYISKKEIIQYRSTSEIPKDKLSFFIKKQERLSDFMKLKYIDEYHKYFFSRKRARIYRENNIFNISDDEIQDIFYSNILYKKNDMSCSISYILENTDLDYNLSLYALNLLINKKRIKVEDGYIVK